MDSRSITLLCADDASLLQAHQTIDTEKSNSRPLAMSTILETRALDHISRRVESSLEEDIMESKSMAPEMIDELHSVFEEATGNALTSILDEPTAKALTFHLRNAGLEGQRGVMAKLDSLLMDGSSILKAAIIEEFRAMVHERLTMVRASFDETFETGPMRTPTSE